MKSFHTPSRHTGAVEPLEARIAPATIYIGAVGAGRENLLDTEYVEDPNAPTPQGPRPATANQISFVDLVQATDAISTKIRDGVGAPLTELNKYFYLHLHAGDTVLQYTTSNSYRPLITVTGGDVIALFTDIDTLTGVTNEFDSNELTGMILSKNAQVQVNGAVNGDIVTGLDTHGTKVFTDDTIDLTSLGTSTSGITNLRVLGGSVQGSILAAGPIKNLTVATNVGEVAAGTAVTNHAFDLLKIQDTNTNGSPKFDLDGNPVFIGDRFTANFTAPAKTAGASIKNVIVGGITDALTAGSGGLGAKGGAISNVLVTQDTDSFSLIAGAGGPSGAGAKTGGAGGNITTVKVLGVSDGTGNSSHGGINGIEMRGGAGGGSAAGSLGGKGGSVSNVTVGYDVGGALSATTLMDGVHVFGGAGGAGKTAGAGGTVSDAKIQVNVTNAINPFGVLVPADNVEIVGGAGGNSTVAGGFDGKGGSVSALVLSNLSTIFSSQTIVRGGDAGLGGITGSTGAAGGAIKTVTILGYDSVLTAGDGSEGLKGGAGGALSNITIRSGDDVIPRNMALSAGTGGAGTTKGGGAGGSLTTLIVETSDIQAFSINAAAGDAAGGTSTQGRGGSGGSITGVRVNDTDFANLTQPSGSGSAIIHAGDAGSGGKGGGAGGSLTGVNIATDRVAFEARAGRGGSATVAGVGGKGGSVSTVFLQNSSVVQVPIVGGGDPTEVPVNYSTTGSLVAGDGGSGLGKGGKGGAGGSINATRLTNDGDESLRAGAGGNGQAGSGGAAAGRGGSVISSLVVSSFGSGELIAGSAGVAGAKPAAGGSIQGELVKVVTDNINGVRAAGSVTIRSGDGSHGGTGGDIIGVAFEGPFADALGVNIAPTGNVLVQSGNGSAEGRFSGRGGNITGVTGTASAAPLVGQTSILAGDGGSSLTATVGAKGGSIQGVTLSGGGSVNSVIVVEAGDAGDSAAAKGAKGGDVSDVSFNNVAVGTVIRSVASGNGGDGKGKGGAAGNIDNVFAPFNEIGFRTGQAFGYTTQGGLFAGVGGDGTRPGVNGSVTNVTAQSISSIVAGARLDPVPRLADTVANISLNTSNDQLLISSNNIFTTSGNFILSFDGQSTPLLNGGSTNLQVAAALNQLSTIKAVGGVNVQYSAAGGYIVTFKNRGNQDLISMMETVTSEVAESIPAGTAILNAFQAAGGATILPSIETQSGQLLFSAASINLGSSLFFANEVEQGTIAVREVQVIELDVLGKSLTSKFTLSFGGATTDLLPANVTAAQLAAALNALTPITDAGGVVVTAGGGTGVNASFTVKFVTPGRTAIITGQAFTPAVEQLDLSLITSTANATFTLTYRGETTVDIPRTATAAQIAQALSMLSTIKNLNEAGTGSVSVSQVIGSPGFFNVTFSENGVQSQITGTGLVAEVQKIMIAGGAAGDSFILRLNDQISTKLKVGSTPEQVQTALNALPRVVAVGGVTVTTDATGAYLVKFNNNGDQLPLTALLLQKEQQTLNLTGTTGTTTDYLLHSEHALDTAETKAGSSVFVPIDEGLANPSQIVTVPGDSQRVVTTVPGNATTAEVQTVNLGAVTGVNGSALKDGDTFTLNYSKGALNENTVPIKFTTDAIQLAKDIDAALAQLPDLNTPNGQGAAQKQVTVTVTGSVVTLTFKDLADQDLFVVETQTPVPHPGSYALPSSTKTQGTATVKEVQEFNVSSVVARGGTLVLTFNGESTTIIPVANKPLAVQVQTALNALNSVITAGLVTVTEVAPAAPPGAVARASDLLDITFGNPGNVPLITGVVSVPESEQVSLVALRADATAEFTLTFQGAKTPEIKANATAAQIQTQLNLLPTVTAQGGVRVFETTTPGVFRIDFNVVGTPAANLPNIVVEGGGQVNHEIQHLDLGSIGAYSSGLFTLTFGDQTTTVLPANASAAEVQLAVNKLATINAIRGDNLGAVIVTKTGNGAYDIEYNRFGNQALVSGQGAVFSDRYPISVVQTIHGTSSIISVTDQRAGAAQPAPVTEVTKGTTTVNELQRVNLSALNAEQLGDFTLTFGNATTAVIAKGPNGANPTTQQVQDALNALPTIRALAPNNAGAVTVSSGSNGVYDIQFSTPGDVGAIGAQFRETESQLVDISTVGTGGEFTLQLGGQKTASIPVNATAQIVAAALNALDSVKQAGGVVVTSAGTSKFSVAFQGLGDAPAIIGEGGASHSEQRIAIGALAGQAGGQFTLTFDGQTTDLITVGATPAETATHIQTALNALNTVKDARAGASGNVAVGVADGSGFFNVVFNTIGDLPTLSGHSVTTTDRAVPVTTPTSGTTTPAAVTTTTAGTTVVKEVQHLDLTAVGAADEFQVRFDNNPADALAEYVSPLLKLGATPAATATTIQNALNALPSVTAAGGVTVTADVGNTFNIAFTVAGNQPDLGASYGRHETQSVNVLSLAKFDLPVTTQTEGGAAQEVQIVNLANVTSEFNLAFNGQRTTILAANATAADVQTALNLLPGVTAAGGVTVTAGTVAKTYNVKFGNTANQPLLTGSGDFSDGLFRVSFGGDTTPAIRLGTLGTSAANLTQVNAALNALPSVKALRPHDQGAVVATYVNGEYVVDFNTLGDQPSLTASGSVAVLPPLDTAHLNDGSTASKLLLNVTEVTTGRALGPVVTLFTNGQTAVNELQTINLANEQAEGAGSQFTLSFRNDITAPISNSATAADIQNALLSLPSVQTLGVGAVTVTANGATGFNVQFNVPGARPLIVAADTDNAAVAIPVSKLVTGNLDTNEVQILDLRNAPSGSVQIQFGAETKTIFIPSAASQSVRAELIQTALNNFATVQASDGNGTGRVNVVSNGVGGLGDNTFSITFSSTINQPQLGVTNLITSEVTQGSPTVQEIQQVDVSSAFGAADSSFVLSFGGAKTATLPTESTVADVQAALNALQPIIDAGGVTVTSGGVGIFQITFGALKDQQGTIVATAGNQEVQHIDTTVFSQAGNSQFLLTFRGETIAAPLPENATAANVQAALSSLPAVVAAGGVVVTQTLDALGVANGFDIAFGSFVDQEAIVASVNVFEQQTLDLQQHGQPLTGYIQLSANGGTTPILPATATAEEISQALNALNTIPGGVLVVEAGPGLFKLNFNQTGAKPLVTGVFNPFGTTERISSLVPLAQIDAALDSISTSDVTVTGTSGGVLTASFTDAGDQIELSGLAITREQQSVDIFAGGNFALTVGGETTALLAANATADQIREALNNLSTVQAIGGVRDVQLTNNSSFLVTFAGDGDQALLLAPETLPPNLVVTRQEGSLTKPEVQIVDYTPNGAFNQAAFARSRLVGAIVDFNEADSNRFHFIDKVTHLPEVASQANPFVLGDTPIDGIIMARVLNRSTLNFIPEAEFTADGFYDNLNRL